MRLVPVVVLALAGCLGGTLDSSFRPAVTPKLSELPADGARRDAVLDAANVTTGPEQGTSQPQLTRRERRAVGAAAFAASILGWVYSKTENVTLGGAVMFDENQLGGSSPLAPDPGPGADSHAADPAAPPATDPATLVPWVKLK